MENSGKKVVLLGASNKPHRYSYMALHRLLDNGYDVIPVHPVIKEVDGVPVVKNIGEIPEDKIHTVTLYIGSERVGELVDEIISLNPERIISNPGTGNENLKKKAIESGIEYIEGCTLVMLSSGQF